MTKYKFIESDEMIISIFFSRISDLFRVKEKYRDSPLLFFSFYPFTAGCRPLSSDLPSLPISSGTDPILPDNGCCVADPSLPWLPLASP